MTDQHPRGGAEGRDAPARKAAHELLMQIDWLNERHDVDLQAAIDHVIAFAERWQQAAGVCRDGRAPLPQWIVELAELSDAAIDEGDPSLWGSFRDAARAALREAEDRREDK